MGGEPEATGDALAGGIVASAIGGKAIENEAIESEATESEAIQGKPIEGQAEAPARSTAHGACRNCGTTLDGRYCSTCAQPVHIHRSLVSLGHDILHGVFHFEGKIWRTIPELFFRPGRLTRRYIDGERAKFVSPMAMFLFTVFLMFAVFSITGGALVAEGRKGADDSDTNLMTSDPSDWKSGVRRSIREADKGIESLQKQLNAADVSPERRVTLESQIGDLRTARDALDAAVKSDRSKHPKPDKISKAVAGAAPEAPRSSSDDGVNVNLGWPALDRKLTDGLRQLNENPELLLYKLKSNGYKFSWALIPMSVPFLWLMFFWRRDIRLYDHAIFVTYSITFVMLLVVLLSIGAALGVSSSISQSALAFVPPIHLYKQLRGAYGVSRTGAFVRLFLLMISICIVLLLFSILLLTLGALD